MLKKQQEQLRQLQMLAQNQQLLQRQMQQLQNIQTKQNEILLNVSVTMLVVVGEQPYGPNTR